MYRTHTSTLLTVTCTSAFHRLDALLLRKQKQIFCTLVQSLEFDGNEARCSLQWRGIRQNMANGRIFFHIYLTKKEN